IHFVAIIVVVFTWCRIMNGIQQTTRQNSKCFVFCKPAWACNALIAVTEILKMNAQTRYPMLLGIGISLGITTAIAFGIAALQDPSHVANAAFMRSRFWPRCYYC
ncbi:MAG: hypothetical protein WBE68_16470, partial [Candidatus Nitrosopolaris sp.]